MASSVQSRQRHADRRLPRNVEDSPSTGFQCPKRTIRDSGRGILLWAAVDTISASATTPAAPKAALAIWPNGLDGIMAGK